MLKGRKAHLSPAQNKKLQIKKPDQYPLIINVADRRAGDFIVAHRPEIAGGEAVRQQLKIDGGKFAPDAALNNRAKELARQTHPPSDYL